MNTCVVSMHPVFWTLCRTNDISKGAIDDVHRGCDGHGGFFASFDNHTAIKTIKYLLMI